MLGPSSFYAAVSPCKKSVKAFTLVELAIVLTIMGAVLAVIWIAANNVYLKQKTGDAMLELQTVTQNILGIWQGRDFGKAGFTAGQSLNKTLITGNTLPDWVITSTTSYTASDPWSSTGLNIYVGGTNLTSTRIFSVIMNTVPSQACIIMATQAASCSYGTSGCPKQIVITPLGGTATAVPQSGNIWSLATEDVAGASYCGAGAASYTLEFDYSL